MHERRRLRLGDKRWRRSLGDSSLLLAHLLVLDQTTPLIYEVGVASLELVLSLCLSPHLLLQLLERERGKTSRVLFIHYEMGQRGSGNRIFNVYE